MPLPLIPLAIAGAAGAGLLGGGAAISSFFDAQASKTKDDTTAGILNTPDLTDTQADALAYQNELNPDSKFQKPGDGWLSDYSQVDTSSVTDVDTTTDNRQYSYTITVESPGASISTNQDNSSQNTQKPSVEHTSTHETEGSSGILGGLGSMLSGVGSSLLVVGLLVVGGYALYRIVSDRSNSGGGQ